MGGEGEALRRLQRFSLERPSHAVTKAKVSNSSEPADDSLYGADFSCKISPWLSMGCLSPRRMFEDLKNGSRLVSYILYFTAWSFNCCSVIHDFWQWAS